MTKFLFTITSIILVILGFYFTFYYYEMIKDESLELMIHNHAILFFYLCLMGVVLGNSFMIINHKGKALKYIAGILCITVLWIIFLFTKYYPVSNEILSFNYNLNFYTSLVVFVITLINVVKGFDSYLSKLTKSMKPELKT